MMDVQPSLTDHRPQAHQHLVSTFTYDLGIAGDLVDMMGQYANILLYVVVVRERVWCGAPIDSRCFLRHRQMLDELLGNQGFDTGF